MLFPLLLSSLALAGPFTERTSMGEWPERQVERQLVLPRGWLQLGISADTKASTAYRDASGLIQQYAEGTTWRYSTFQLEVDQGFAKRLSLYARVPFVLSSLHNDRGANASTLALGDVHTGLVFQPWLGKPSQVALRLDLKSPSGMEWPSNYLGGPSATQDFLTGTGVTNLAPFLEFRQRFGRVAALTVQGGYVWKFPAIVGYVMEDDGWGLGWIDPGNEILVLADTTGQIIDDLAITAFSRFSHRGVYAIGTKGEGTGAPNLDPIDGSAGSFLDVGGNLSYEPVEHVDIVARASTQVVGSDTRIFAPLGLDEFSPQPGLTFGLTGVVRW